MQKRLTHLYIYLLAVLVGVVSGLVAASFHYVLDFLAEQRLSLHSLLSDFLVPGTSTPMPGWLLLAAGSAVLVCLSLWLVKRFAPEAHGSGIPQVETILSGSVRIRWWRVLPVKFLGGVCAIAPGMVLGREGPTIHMGAACGQMIADTGRPDGKHHKSLVSAGVAAGLGAAFNAPLAAIMLVTEEMREEFDYNHVSLLCVILASCAAVVVSNAWLGQGLELGLASVGRAPLRELPLYLLLGVLVGVFAVFFNRCLLFTVAWFGGLRKLHSYLAAAAVGMLVGVLTWFTPELVGGGERLVEQLAGRQSTLSFLVVILLLRALGSLLCYGTGVPGGIFAPLLALGALLGLAFSSIVESLMPGLVSTPAMFMVAAMGALFAGTVRAPLTAIVLIVELTGDFNAILSILITCMVATMVAEGLAGKPIYSQLRLLGGSSGHQ